MNQVTENVHILTPAQTVFGLVANARRAPDWMTSLILVTNLVEDGPNTSYDWVFKVAGVALRGSSKVTMYAPDRIVETRTGGVVDSTWHYQFVDRDGATQVFLEVQYTIPNEMSGLMADELLRRVHEREVRGSLANLKGLFEQPSKTSAAA